MHNQFEKDIKLNALAYSKEVIAIEAQELQAMSDRLDERFEKAVQLVLECQGRVVVFGMGKSGIIGRKIAATFSSTGTPSIFVHPGEAFHGDLGMVQPLDVLLLISNSGETEELTRLLPYFKDKNKIIGVTGKLDSSLAKVSEVVLDISVQKEACHNNLAPTSSTTNTLVMGDALAVAVSRIKGFEAQDFARYHPGGSLGRRLLTKVSDVMRADNLPFCDANDTMKKVVTKISEGRLGAVLVVDNNKLAGIITDGDIRRAIEARDDFMAVQAKMIMSSKPRTISASRMLGEAENRMRDLKINSLVVVDDETGQKVLGILQIWS